MITNYNTIDSICYKKIANQVSAGGTHGTRTYIIVSRSPGEYKIGKQAILSNSGKTYFEIPYKVTL